MGFLASWARTRRSADAAQQHEEGTRLLAADRTEEAERRLRAAADTRRELLGPDAADTLDSRIARCQALILLRHLDRAETEILDVSARVREQAERAPEQWAARAARTGYVRALLLHHCGRLAQAEEQARAVLAGCADRPALITERLQAGDLLCRVTGDRGRHAEAVALLAGHAELVARTAPAAAAVLALKARSDRCQQLAYLGRYEEAEGEARAIAGSAAAVPGPHGRYLALAAANALAFSLASHGRWAEAEQVGRAALDRADTAAPHRVDLFAATLRLGLARSLSGQGRYAEALDAAAEAERDLHSPDHLAAAATTAGTALLGLGRHQEAVERARRAQEFCRTSLGPGHHRALEADTLLGLALTGAGRSEEATRVLERAVTDWRAGFGDAHPRTAAAVAALARVGDAAA
ncbi:tetratricopeptide repeat protein [Kitasatospora sp. NPDC049258]|uniref:tetratricopeptide repeat protein n=1 Tax=Kitasatospora sp. NPDC049258 TaxID=3155394 RepID=UPI00342FC490